MSPDYKEGEAWINIKNGKMFEFVDGEWIHKTTIKPKQRNNSRA
jgi:hypothetical protein